MRVVKFTKVETGSYVADVEDLHFEAFRAPDNDNWWVLFYSRRFVDADGHKVIKNLGQYDRIQTLASAKRMTQMLVEDLNR